MGVINAAGEVGGVQVARVQIRSEPGLLWPLIRYLIKGIVKVIGPFGPETVEMLSIHCDRAQKAL